MEFVLLYSVVFTLKLQEPVLSPTSKEDKYLEENNKEQRWSKKKSLLYLLFAVAWMAIVSGMMVDSEEDVGQKLGLSELFIGAVIIGMVGNTANHSSAITLALKGKMNLALNIGIGSGTQLVLSVVPLLVIFGILSVATLL